MKRVIGYTRISTKDQSTYSLEGQAEYIRNYCEKLGYELVGVFQDDGQSAKNFDRASWKELEAYVKKNHRGIDYLVVCKYDRFARSLSDALVMIDKLEKKYGVVILSVMEPINLHPSSPYFFQFRTQMLMGAQVELMIIKDRTKFGLLQAAKEGRHANRAPYGYVNTAEGRRKRLEIVPEQAALVRQAYKLCLQGVGLNAIRERMKTQGWVIAGHSTLKSVLTNPVYAGMVKKPAYYDEKEELLPAAHEPIVDRATWWQVQAKLNGRDATRVAINPEVPLRGAVRCACGQLLTAGNSKGRTRHYWYYLCNVHKKNFRADKLHAQFDAILDELSLTPKQIDYLLQITQTNLEEAIKASANELNDRQRELNKVRADIERLEEKYLKDEVDCETYVKWRTRWQGDAGRLELQVDALRMPMEDVWAIRAKVLHELLNLKECYQAADIAGKHAFISIGFDSKLWYENDCYRTTYMHPFFALKALALKEKGLLIYQQAFESKDVNPARSEIGT